MTRNVQIEEEFHMVIKNTTVLSGDEVKSELVQISKKNYYTRYGLVAILAVFGVIILILSMNSGAADTMMTGYMFFGFAIAFAIYNTISMTQIPKKVVKKNGYVTTSGMTNFFTFKEESFQLAVKMGTDTAKYEMPYTNLKRIVRLEDRILFMVTSTDIFVAKHDGFPSAKEVDVFFFGLQKHKIKVKDKRKK